MAITKVYKSNTLVILDAGHGIDTPGKRSPIWSDGTQLFEWEFNRDVVNIISEFLNTSKISHSILINCDMDISLSSRVLEINNLVSKLKMTYKVYLVSVHGNASESSKARGIEVFTSVGETKSDRIASVFINHLKSLRWPMRLDLSDGDPDKEANFKIIKDTTCPAILTENGFYTNEEECRMMLSKEWRTKIALAHVKAIEEVERRHDEIFS